MTASTKAAGRVAILACLMLAASQPSVHAVISYTVTDLGTLGGGSPVPSAINNRGQIVGRLQYMSSPSRAFFWSPGGALEDLGTLPGGTSSVAADINDSGLVVGYAETASSSQHAFIYRGSGPLEDLGTVGGAESAAFGINNRGQIVGRSDIDGSSYHAFLYSDGQMQDMGTLGGTSSWAMTINDNGQFVGWSQIAGNAAGHAYVYSSGIMQDVGTLGGTVSQGITINASGQVAGSSSLAGDQVTHAFLWSPGGTMMDLGSLSDAASSIPLGINKAGHVVGESGGSGGPCAFLYDGNTMIDLNDLIDPSSSWVLESATDINDLGQIVGEGWRTVDGYSHKGAFLLTPIPEPAMLTLLALGGLALTRGRPRP